MKQQNKNSGFQRNQQSGLGIAGSQRQQDQQKWQAFSDESVRSSSSGNRTIQQQRQQQRQQEGSSYGPTRSQAGGLRAG